MLGTFREGGDVYTATARRITGREEVTNEERKLAKAVNFSQGAKGLKNYSRNNCSVEMILEEVDTYRARFFETYGAIARWHAADDARLRRGQFDTRILAGRLRQDVRFYTELLKATVQGTGADGMKIALALLWGWRSP